MCAVMVALVLLTLGGFAGSTFQGHVDAGQILANDGGSGAGD
jgi:hypothetical protein